MLQSNNVDQARIAALLRTRSVGRALRLLGQCRSTNDEALAWARAGAPHGAVLIADGQSAGRGRLGRTWHSPPGENLYFSTVLRPPLSPRAAPPLALVAAVAVAETARAFGAAPDLKWPNDLLLDGRKAAGILCELLARPPPAERVDAVVVGIGVNLNGHAFPEELATRATSLALVTGAAIDREAFVATLCERLEAWHDRLVADGPAPVVAAWKGFARLLGRAVSVDNGRERITGVAEDLDAEGALLVRRADGVLLRVFAGELSPGPT